MHKLIFVFPENVGILSCDPLIFRADNTQLKSFFLKLPSKSTKTIYDDKNTFY